LPSTLRLTSVIQQSTSLARISTPVGMTWSVHLAVPAWVASIRVALWSRRLMMSATLFLLNPTGRPIK
jgi:hypothetical protein